MQRHLCLFCFILIAARAAARPNLVPNSSFEQGDAGWHFWRRHPGGAVFLSLGREDTTARPGDGTAAASLQRHDRQAAGAAIEEMQTQELASLAQAARRGVVLARVRKALASGDAKGAARFALHARTVLALELPKPDLLVARATTPIKVDADLADWPDRWIVIPSTRAAVGQRPKKDDLRPRFQLLWDDRALYLACQADDDKVLARSGSVDLWKADCAGAFLDLLIDHPVTGPAYGPDDYQFFLTPAGGFSLSHSGATRPEIQFAAKPVDSGWALEMALPWDQLGIAAPAAGFTFGFDPGIDDADQPEEQRETQLMWHGTGQNYRNATRFGVARLAADTGR